MKRMFVTLALAALALPIFVGISTAQASANASIKCGTVAGQTYGWVTSPVNGLKVGAKYCRTMTPLRYNPEGTLAAFWFTATNGKWVPTSNNLPNAGGSSASAKAHAKAAKDLAAKYGLHVSFTKYTGYRDSVGYVTKNGVGLAGTYYTSPMYPGRGLIELSNGGNSLSAADATIGKTTARSHILDTVKHEISHGRIELKCGTTRPPIVGERHEQVTDAYAVTHFGKKRISYPHTAADIDKAKKIARGICE